MKHKALIVTYYWPPSGGSGVQRWVKFAKYLPQFGVEPIILTVKNPTYASLDDSLEDDIPETTRVYKSLSIEPFGLYSGISGKSKTEVAKPSTQIGTGDSLLARAASWIRSNVFIPDARVGWVLTARKKALQLVREYDIQTVITTGPPHSTHLVGKHLKKQTPVRWIADFRDPWSKIFYNESLNRSGLAARVDLKLEQSVLKTADEVIVTAPSMKKLQKGITDRTYTYIPNGFDPEDFHSVDSSGTSSRQNEIFTIRHIGTLPESSVPYGLFKALNQVRDSTAFRLELIGNVHPDVNKLIEQYGLQKEVRIKPYVPHQEAIELMKASDLLLLIIPDTSHSDNIIPGKLFEYIGSRRPILSIGAPNGDAAAIVTELQKGEAYEHADTAGQKAFLVRALQGKLNNKAVSDDDQPGFEHPYSRYYLTKKLYTLVEKTGKHQPNRIGK